MRQGFGLAASPAPPEPVVESVHGFAAERMGEGAVPSEIQANLTRPALDADPAVTVVNNLKRAEATAKREAARKHLLHGALWCIGGLVVTAASYQMATGRGGGTSVIAWGAILFGGIQILRGLSQLAGEYPRLLIMKYVRGVTSERPRAIDHDVNGRNN